MLFEEKVDLNRAKKDYSTPKSIQKYRNLAQNYGLWKSESIVIKKFLNKEALVLDIGCGAGRTTFGLYELGYKNLLGVDISKKLIKQAKAIAKSKNIKIKFEVGNCLILNYGNNSFDAVFFSYNGLMTIPGYHNRMKAVSEINRVLKENGIFIFTTHDRNQNPDRINEWRQEKKKWLNGTQDQRYFDFGDKFVNDNGQELFLHIPDTKEVYSMLTKNNFEILYTKSRSEICPVPEHEKKEFGECRFFVAKKVKH